MKMFIVSLGVIFMLSTVVRATDCCSSRILLIKEESLKLLRQRQATLTPSINPSNSPSKSSSSSTSSQLNHAEVMANMAREYSKTFFSGFREEPQQRKHNTTSEEDSTEEDDTDFIKRRPDQAIGKTSLIVDTELHTKSPPVVPVSTQSKIHRSQQQQRRHDLETRDEETVTADANTFIIDPVVREKYAGNPKYHVIDLYYTIMRDVLSYECFGNFLTDFCLNGGRCFRYPIANHSFYSCECADGYIGERCESKSLVNEPLYIPSSSVVSAKNQSLRRPRIRMARFVFTFPALIVLSTTYILIAAVLFVHQSKQRHATRFGAAPFDFL